MTWVLGNYSDKRSEKQIKISGESHALLTWDMIKASGNLDSGPIEEQSIKNIIIEIATGDIARMHVETYDGESASFDLKSISVQTENRVRAIQEEWSKMERGLPYDDRYTTPDDPTYIAYKKSFKNKSDKSNS